MHQLDCWTRRSRSWQCLHTLAGGRTDSESLSGHCRVVDTDVEQLGVDEAETVDYLKK